MFLFKLETRCPLQICTTWSEVSKQLYQEILSRLSDAVHRKRLELWENQSWMLHHDSAPAHGSLLVHSYLAHQTSTVTHSPYSPELAPSDFFLFPRFKTIFKGCCFQGIEEIQETAIRELQAIIESALQEAFQ